MTRRLPIFCVIAACLMGAVSCAEDEEEQDAPVSAPDGYDNGYAYVDLGLPSGNKWATANIDAKSAKYCGTYFAWGELYSYLEFDYDNYSNYRYNKFSTHEKGYYVFASYKHADRSYNNLQKYNYDPDYGKVDSLYVLGIEDDAAAQRWGGNWHIPSVKDFEELMSECLVEWTRNYNNTWIAGIIVYKPKNDADRNVAIEEVDTAKLAASYNLMDAHIFIPSAGYRIDSLLYISNVRNAYWTNELDSVTPTNAKTFSFEYAEYKIGEGPRCEGYTIRPVTK
ncbi:MAG: hypothetical protein K6E54_00765 [Bacteroidaceae bacterium]|nr:hypothetical protein [Bacteroidaceae bacterium]